MDRYDPQQIEAKWQRVWEDEQASVVPNPDGDSADRRKSYVLEMLPYPSGTLHLGHLLVYTIGDVATHFRRRNGYRVLHPMGFDAFGLPAENAAIREGAHPRPTTDRHIAGIRRSMHRIGWWIDWPRELSTHEPSYYRWQQWQFLKFLERGLAYRKGAHVKWCPNDQTVVANEQVLADGTCERCGAEVESRVMEQWFFRITDYADALLDDLETVTWPESIKARQRNWIGRSEGAEIVFRIEDSDDAVTVFTTRPDTLFGATFFVLAPEHELVAGLASDDVKQYVRRAAAKKTKDRAAADEKTGVDTGLHAINPVNGERIPIYVADYVLPDYGTGAIMAVPAHDQRDFDFARAHGLPIRQVVAPVGGDVDESEPYVEHSEGEVLVNSGEFDGLPADEGGRRIVERLEREASAASRSTSACATGASRGSGTGGARSPSSTATPAGSFPSRRASCPSSFRTSRTTCRRAGRRWHRRRTGSTPPAPPAAAPPSERPRRWTRSSTRPGTSCATAIRTTTPRRSIARSSTTGTRSTSTSAASTTPRCT